MTSINRRNENFVIDAALLAEAFKLTVHEVRQRMRDGHITSRCEAGIDEDEGRWRLTFIHRDSLCRFIVDDAGNVLKKATFPVKPRHMDPSRERDET